MRSFFGLMATSVVVWFGLSIGAAMAEGLDEQATNPGDYFTDDPKTKQSGRFDYRRI